MVFIFRTIFLLWYVLNMGQILDIHSLFRTEKRSEPRAPLWLGWDPGQLDIVLEADCVLFTLLHNAPLAFLCLYPGGCLAIVTRILR